MSRPQIVIENPILNPPYEAPARHFRFDDEGITDDVVDGRRPSSYFMPIPKAKKKGGQLVFDEWTGDRIEENRLINQIRERIGRWRELGWPGVTPTTRALLEKVMQDTGLSKGIVVSVGGLRSGARVAAEQAHIDVWGPDEIRHYLGEDALAGLPLAAPDEALGIEVTIGRDAAEREIKKARGGFAGIGTEEIASIDLLWVPAVELQLAVTRVRPGLVKDRDEVIRRWNLFEILAGRMVGQRDEPRAFVTVALLGPTVRAQKSSPQIVSDMRRTVAKHRNAKSEAAQKTRQAAYNAIGLPGSTREFAIEAEKQVFVPYFVGLLRRKGAERFVAIHAGLGARTEAVEQALHEKIDVVRAAIDAVISPQTPIDDDIGKSVVTAASTASKPRAEPPTCKCSAVMVLRHRKADGAAFWGCSTFPRCRHTLAVD